MPHPSHITANHKGIAATERQRQALELRKAGVGFQAIADRLGYSDHSGAYRAVKSALKKTLQEPADEVRALELERLDKLLLGLWPRATSGNDRAIDRVLKIMQRRANLLGLDAPQKVENTGKGGGPIQHQIQNGPDLSTVLTLEQRFQLDQILAAAEEAGR